MSLRTRITVLVLVTTLRVLAMCAGGGAIAAAVAHAAGLPIVWPAVGAAALVPFLLLGRLKRRARIRLESEGRPPRRITRGRVVPVRSADGTPLHVEVEGPGREPITVVFCHGELTDLTLWDRQREELRGSTVRRVYFDLRGHGRSGTWAARESRDAVSVLVDDLAAVVETTAPTGGLILVGHSVAAKAVLVYAQRHQRELVGRLAGVMLLSATAGPPPRRPRQKYAAARLALGQRLPGFVTTAMGADRQLLGRPAAPGTTPRAAAALVEALFSADVREATWAVERTRTMVLVTERDQLVPPESQLELARSIRECRLLSVPGVGHFAPQQAAETVTRELRALLATGHPVVPQQARRPLLRRPTLKG